MRIEVLVVMNMKVTALRDVMPSSLVKIHQCFSKYAHLQGKRSFSTLNVEALIFIENH
jgi:hypothetical protein